MTRTARLGSARVAWRHSLRFRLALVYTLVALALVSVIGLGVMTLLLRSMDQQFQTRLEERADTLAEAFLAGRQGLGKSPGGTGTYTMIVGEDGQVLAATPSLLQYEIGRAHV